ncbi:MAG: phosphoribosylformimino-5-aminoimidazole carboxamide ribotide isomerase [Butyrivibrio sp.]|nr:phosphoribosylformimino-5-aminoimidazole carboxamide ribotide isomerase [Butyrivibrio sp.]
MRFRPCIDIHNGKVKQIVGSTLRDMDDSAYDNYVSEKGADYYARMYRELGLSGGHIILLNPVDSPFYEMTRVQGVKALNATPGLLQIGGGITDENAKGFLDAGASHVIVTSFVFRNGRVNLTNLKKLVKAVGKERIVLDLSCKALDTSDGGREYYVVTDRWQKMTSEKLDEELLDKLSAYCDEFLVHAADVEGKQSGIEKEVAGIIGSWGRIPVTYAGGVKDVSDIRRIKEIGGVKVDVTVGSALDIFGGSLKLEDAIRACAE